MSRSSEVGFPHEELYRPLPFAFDRFLFTDNARMTTLVGEKFVVGMIGTLCDALELEYGILIPRLYRIFRPLKGIYPQLF